MLHDPQVCDYPYDPVIPADVVDLGDLEIPFESIFLIQSVIVRIIGGVVVERIDVPVRDMSRILERATPVGGRHLDPTRYPRR
jgi:hypothetical protein